MFLGQLAQGRAQQQPVQRGVHLVRSRAVCDLFQEEESGSLAMLSDFIGKPVSLQVETSYTQEQYDIVLL